MTASSSCEDGLDTDYGAVTALWDALPWVGHEDPLTVAHYAFHSGIRDGQALSFGNSWPAPSSEVAEKYYLRGFAIGVCDWRHDKVGLAGLVADHAALPRDPRRFDFRPPGVPAILPWPGTRAPRPPRHAAQDDAPFRAASLSQLPVPDGVDRDALTLDWPLPLRRQCYTAGTAGCWFVPECRRTAAVPVARVAEFVRELSSFLWPTGPSLSVTAPSAQGSLARTGAVFVSGEESQVRLLTDGRAWTSNRMCVFVLVNSPPLSDFVCTFGSAYGSRYEEEDALLAIREALDNSAVARGFCDHGGLSSAAVFSSLRLEYLYLPRSVDGGPAHLWNVYMVQPAAASGGLRAWRWIVGDLTPRDSSSALMVRVSLECEVCSSIPHASELCPTRAYDAWQGAVCV